ncbi:hypothetical protein SAMN05216378_2246 [Paenibacillus catalpae]|uniref:GIY-YIG domain-containing protein n=1 Tax=Paenibacillus catalpae TaxID=1045775 RepID=A0A1I1XKI0_9BACL|nr:hypothetical protein [Paenibacillus catalpae]SFE07909.1 hypothetical protein SAMN05216378_2246 [Paenibacillus catalpae]
MDKILEALLGGVKKQYSKSKAMIPPKVYDVSPQSQKEIFDMKFPGLYIFYGQTSYCSKQKVLYIGISGAKGGVGIGVQNQINKRKSDPDFQKNMKELGYDGVIHYDTASFLDSTKATVLLEEIHIVEFEGKENLKLVEMFLCIEEEPLFCNRHITEPMKDRHKRYMEECEDEVLQAD